MKSIFIAAAIFLFSILPAFAQDHNHHPPEEQEIHERFYSTWMEPDAPWVSCCHKEDCHPAASRFVNGHWQARWKDEDEWTDIPDAKVEEIKTSPDGRSHMCGRRWGIRSDIDVFCFVRGGGV